MKSTLFTLNPPVQTKLTTHRQTNVDILRALSIVCVCFIHGSLTVPTSPSYVLSGQWVLRFCVPVFIVIWAYFVEISISKQENKGQYLLQRFKKLAIPFIVWSAVYYLMSGDVQKISLKSAVTKYWLGYGWMGQFYFIILFQLIAFYLVIRPIGYVFINRVALFLIGSIFFYSLLTFTPLASIGIVQKLNNRPFFFWIPYVVLGILYAKARERWSIPFYVALSAPLLIFFEHHYLASKYSLMYLTPAIFITTVCLTGAFICRSKQIKLSASVNQLVSTLSRNSLGIFCLNPLIIIGLGWFTDTYNLHTSFLGSFLIVPILLTVLVTGLCLLAIWLLKKLGLGRLVAN